MYRCEVKSDVYMRVNILYHTTTAHKDNYSGKLLQQFKNRIPHLWTILAQQFDDS